MVYGLILRNVTPLKPTELTQSSAHQMHQLSDIYPNCFVGIAMVYKGTFIDHGIGSLTRMQSNRLRFLNKVEIIYLILLSIITWMVIWLWYSYFISIV